MKKLHGITNSTIRNSLLLYKRENGYSAPLVSNLATSQCKCYELTLTYEGCDSEIIEQVSYFQVGDDCENDLGGTIIGHSLKDHSSDAGNVKVWPNPVGNELNIDILKINENFGEELKFEVYDVNGRQVFSTQLAVIEGSQNIQLDLPSGMFLYRISSGEFTQLDRFVKK